METSCLKCHLKAEKTVLQCGHSVCYNCHPRTCSTATICPQCSLASIIESEVDNREYDPEHCLVCLDCRNELVRMREFLEGRHRSHQVTTVSKFIPEVQKTLRKHQLSFDLENQALFSQIESMAQEKRLVSEQYSNNVASIRQAFARVEAVLREKELALTAQYERMIMERVGKIDEKIQQIRAQIKKCESYTFCIDIHLTKGSHKQSVDCTEFYLAFDPILSSFSNELAQKRISQRLTVEQMPQLNLAGIEELERSSAKLVMWGISPAKKTDKTSTTNPIDSYFEAKRKEIFSDKNAQKEWKQTEEANKETECSMERSFNIDGRIENMRRALKIGQRERERDGTSFGSYLRAQ